MIDSSGSIGRSNWGRMKRFLKAVVSKLDVSPSGTHIAAVSYSTDPEIVLLFSNTQNTVEVNKAFDGMRWQRGFTFTDKALLLADSDLFQTANGMRPSVSKVKCTLLCYFLNVILVISCFFVIAIMGTPLTRAGDILIETFPTFHFGLMNKRTRTRLGWTFSYISRLIDSTLTLTWHHIARWIAEKVY